MPSSKNDLRRVCYCGTEFYCKPKGRVKAKYCSKTCSDAVNQTTERQYQRLARDDSPVSFIKLLLAQPDRASLSVDDVMDIYNLQEGKCALTGIPLTYRRQVGIKLKTNLSLDRIEAGGPYIKENVRLVCSIVNKMRLDMTDEELKYWCSKILENN